MFSLFWLLNYKFIILIRDKCLKRHGLFLITTNESQFQGIVMMFALLLGFLHLGYGICLLSINSNMQEREFSLVFSLCFFVMKV